MPEPRCAYCRARPVEPTWRPFCSERCKMTDLGRWLRGDYRAAPESPGEIDAPDRAPDSRRGEADDADELPHLWPKR